MWRGSCVCIQFSFSVMGGAKEGGGRGHKCWRREDILHGDTWESARRHQFLFHMRICRTEERTTSIPVASPRASGASLTMLDHSLGNQS